MSDLTFRAKAPGIMRRLMADLQIGEEDAAAMLGNFGVETGGFSLLYEVGKPRARQGFGWAQWTGSRRDDFERWAAQKGLDPESDEANYGFLLHELTNTWEKRALPALRAAVGIEAKTLSFMKLYERPGTSHADRRVAMARAALEAFRTGQLPSAPTPQKPEPSTMPSVVPDDWMPRAAMHRIIVHWTAGSHKASATDRSHYHVLIEGDGTVVRGDPSITGNQPPLRNYAAHTLNCNSGSIGVSMCAMAGAQEGGSYGKSPLTKAQWDKMIEVVAALCYRYGIKVTSQTVLTHAEVERNLNIKQRGKWDIAVLPFDPTFDTAAKCGARLRSEVQNRLARGALATPTVPKAAPEAPQKPAEKPAPKGDAAAGGAIVATGGAVAAGWTWFRDHLPEIFLGLVALIALALIAYRIIKGHWPWTGKASQASSPPSLPSWEPSSAPALGHLEELSAALQVKPSPAGLEPKRHRKRSAAPSRKTRKRAPSSRSSKPKKASASLRKRTSKSRS